MVFAEPLCLGAWGQLWSTAAAESGLKHGMHHMSTITVDLVRGACVLSPRPARRNRRLTPAPAVSCGAGTTRGGTEQAHSNDAEAVCVESGCRARFTLQRSRAWLLPYCGSACCLDRHELLCVTVRIWHEGHAAAFADGNSVALARRLALGAPAALGATATRLPRASARVPDSSPTERDLAANDPRTRGPRTCSL